MLTELQKQVLIRAALYTFKLQKGLDFNANNFDLYVDKPGEKSACSIYIFSKRQDDNFRLKLYVTGFTNFTNIENFVFTQEQNYSTGTNDEIHVANCNLDKNEFRSFQFYLYSKAFTDDVVNATDRLKNEEEEGSFFVLENDSGNLVAEQ